MPAINRNRDGSHDIGLMQINSMHLPDLARQGITRQRLLDEPCLSIDVGASILSGFIRRHGRTCAPSARTTPAVRRTERPPGRAMSSGYGRSTWNWRASANGAAGLAADMGGEYRVRLLRRDWRLRARMPRRQQGRRRRADRPG